MILLLLILLAPTLVGHVTDPAGRPVAGATVRLLRTDAPPIETRADNNGTFRVEATGRFQLEIANPGYRTVRTSEIDISSDGIFEIDDIALLPGNPADIDRLEFQIGGPDELNLRDAPGAREGLPRADRLFGLRGGINVTGIAEGSGQQWLAASGNVFTSSASNVSESSDFSAELGDAGETDDGLPAGQETAHGSLYYFHRNNLLNARNYFDPPGVSIPPFKYHFLGGDAGGRIREGTYLYGQYWGLRIRQSITRAATVPDPAWLVGDFSTAALPILDPETGFPFPGNRIPTNRFHPAGIALARMYPAPNVLGAAVQNYRAVGKLSTAADAFGLRIDQRLSSSDEGFLEYQFNRDTTDDPFNLLGGITNLPSFGVRDALETHLLRLHNTHIVSPVLIHQFRVSFSYLNQPRTILQSGAVPGPAVLITGLSNIGYAANLPQRRRSRNLEILSDVSWQQGAAVTKVGGAFRYFPFDAYMDLHARGQFQFTGGIFSEHPFANLLLGLPTNALRLEGDTSRNFRTRTSGAYVQREWQLLPLLSVNAGLRYEYQSPFREARRRAANFDSTTGQLIVRSGDLYRSDRNNFAPRIGLAWQSWRSIIVRAGYGIFYDTLAVGDSLFLLGLNPPFVRSELENNGPVIPQFNLGTVFQAGSTAVPPSIFSTSEDLPNPYLQQWNLSIQRLLWRDIGIEVSYFGQKGTRLRRQVNLNQPSAGLADSLDERRPFAQFRNIFQFETSASSIAHGIEARAVRRFRSGLNFTLAYRFARWIDDATLISMLPQNSHDLRGERGLADFHVKQRAVFSGSYNLPTLTAFPSLTRGWELQGIGVAQSGTPLSAVLGTDYAGTGSPIVNRPDLVANPNDSAKSPSQFFETDAFRLPERGHFGNSGRNVIIGPGLWNVDLALTRTMRASDFTRVQFRADLYNVFNHPNFVAPPSMQNFADSPDFGVLFVARSPRIAQFGLKLLW